MLKPFVASEKPGHQVISEAIEAAKTDLSGGRNGQLLLIQVQARAGELIPPAHREKICIEVLALAETITAGIGETVLLDDFVFFLDRQIGKKRLQELLLEGKHLWEIVDCERDHCPVGYHVETTDPKLLRAALQRATCEGLIDALFDGIGLIDLRARMSRPGDENVEQAVPPIRDTDDN